MRSLVPLLLILVVGCAIREPQAPFTVDGPHATLTLDAPELHEKGFGLYENVVDVAVFDGSKGCPWGENSKFNETLLISRNLSRFVPSQTIQVPVSEKIYLEIKDNYANTTCFQVLKFSAKEGKEYEARIFVNHEVGSPCNAFIVVKNGGQLSKEPSFKAQKLSKNVWLNQMSYDEACD